MSCVFTPSRCHINLGAIARNFSRLGPAGELAPVIKSDAYGHGLLQVAQILDKAGAVRFAVGGAPEGEELRKAGFRQQILLLLGCLSPIDWEMAKKYELTPLVGSFADLERASALHTRLSIAIKCDTGMGRLGFREDDAVLVAEKLRDSPLLEPVFVASHLACADMPGENEHTLEQIRLFENFYSILKSHFPKIGATLGNSAATIALNEHRYTYARPGIALYGGDPFYGTALQGASGELEWAMSISAPIMQIRDLLPGQSVSYGRLFIATRPTRVAVVASGYATGVNRHLSNRMSALVNGIRVPQIGRVCMGMLMLDVSEIDGVEQGDDAWLMGGEAKNGQKAVDAQEIATLLDTIPYEILCLMGSLNPRVYYF